MTTPEARSRIEIDRLLAAAGWRVCDCRQGDLHAARGVAIREFPLEAGDGDADYPFYIHGDPPGVVAGNKHGPTPTSPHAPLITGGSGRPS